MNADELNLLVFAQSTNLKLDLAGGDSPWRASVWLQTNNFYAVGYGDRPWSAVEACYKDVCRQIGAAHLRQRRTTDEV
jgi:hypothetical protein